MVYSSKDKIKEVKIETPTMVTEPGMADRASRFSTTKGQNEPRKGFSTAAKRMKGGVSGVASSAGPKQPDQKPGVGASVPAAAAARTQDGKDVFALKPDDWRKRQAKILGTGRVL